MCSQLKMKLRARVFMYAFSRQCGWGVLASIMRALQHPDTRLKLDYTGRSSNFNWYGKHKLWNRSNRAPTQTKTAIGKNYRSTGL